jgi:class 3 adenylate cyclase
MTSGEPVRQQRVVLFTDVHHFSIAARQLGDAAAATFLQRMYTRLGDVIIDYDGEIIDYLGDGMLCVFPGGRGDLAVGAAVVARRVFVDLVASLGFPSATVLEVGISSGDVMVDTIGHPSFRKRDVLGEAVNEAATLCHHQGIAVTDAVHDQIASTRETRRLPDARLKWQDAPLRVWEIVEGAGNVPA